MSSVPAVEAYLPESDWTEYSCARPDLFERLSDQNWFKRFLRTQYSIIYLSGRLRPQIIMNRLDESFELWQKDLVRIRHVEENVGEPDHLKQAGHLAYWLRRAAPISEAVPALAGDEMPVQTWPIVVQTFGSEMLAERQKILRDMLLQYGNEYAAFDIGFRICRYFEAKRIERSPDRSEGAAVPQDIRNMNPSLSYLHDVAHFLKEKNVSPHALYLIYRSLFLELRPMPPAP